MKKIFLFALVASLLFAVSCDKKEMKPEKELTKLEQLKEMSGGQGQFVKSPNKSENLLGLDGTLYNYNSDANDTENAQAIFLVEQDINDVENIIKNMPQEKGIFPTYTKGTLVITDHSIECTSLFSNCLGYSGIIFY